MNDAGLTGIRRDKIGFVFQKFNLLPTLTARANIEVASHIHGTTRKEGCDRHLADILQLLVINDKMERKPSELSGGEQQRVAISVALANKPKLLLADEPTGEVDEANAQKIYQIFKDLNHELNLTTLIVSHDLNLAKHVDRVVAIRDGKVSSETLRDHRPRADGDPAEAEHASAFTELIVLDSAGRMQIPKELREQLGLRRYARLEVVEDGILIRPVEDHPVGHHDTKSVFSETDAAPKETRLQRLLRRWLPKRGDER